MLSSQLTPSSCTTVRTTLAFEPKPCSTQAVHSQGLSSAELPVSAQHRTWLLGSLCPTTPYRAGTGFVRSEALLTQPNPLPFFLLQSQICSEVWGLSLPSSASSLSSLNGHSSVLHPQYTSCPPTLCQQVFLGGTDSAVLSLPSPTQEWS